MKYQNSIVMILIVVCLIFLIGCTERSSNNNEVLVTFNDEFTLHQNQFYFPSRRGERAAVK